MKRKQLLLTLGILLASVIAFTGCDDVLAEIQKGLGAANSAYGIVLSEAEAVAVDSSGAKPLLVVNSGTKATGTLRAELTGEGREAFVLSKTELPSIEAGGSASFTVTPKADLEEGTYTATVTVSGANDISASFGVSFTEETEYVDNFKDIVTKMEKDADKSSVHYILPGGPDEDWYTSNRTLNTTNCPANVVIDGNEYGWTVQGAWNQITVGNGITLTLQYIIFNKISFIVEVGGTLILDEWSSVVQNAGTLSTAAGTAGITVKGGNLVMNKHTSVIGNGYSGIVLTGEKANFTLDGGTIAQNLGIEGGGVRVEGGSFTMENGLIWDNICRDESGDGAQSGGGVALVGANTVFNMKGGEISGNYDGWENGGGVWLYGSGSIFNMSGGVIRDNQASDGGGGVMMQGVNSKFNMSDTAEISGNKADSGVKINSGEFTMAGGTISDHNASGITVNGGKLEMYDGAAIKNNRGSSSMNVGGGVTINGGIFTMYGGKISDNEMASLTDEPIGGGVGIGEGGVFTMSGGEISDNSAWSGGGGGGVAAWGNNSEFTMSGGALITRNFASGSGGGVLLHYGLSTITFNMNGGEISWNTTSGDGMNGDGGGVAIRGRISSQTFNMSGGVIKNNEGGNGGGVWMYPGNTFNMTGGEITGNKARGIGGVVGNPVPAPQIGGETAPPPGKGWIHGNIPNDM